jgi:hypothetical protein
MQKFVKSLGTVRRGELGRCFVNVLATGEDNLAIAFQIALEKFFAWEFDEPEVEGFETVCAEMAARVIDGKAESLADLQKEFAAVIYQDRG